MAGKLQVDLTGETLVITGGGGVLCSVMAKAAAQAGANVAVVDVMKDAAEKVASEINDSGGKAAGVQADVLDRDSLERAREEVEKTVGPPTILINGAGGNKKEATASPDKSFFDLPADAFQWVFNLNFIGTLLTTQVFGKTMADKGEGNIINISSMNSFRPLTNIAAYSAAKAAVSNFTQWLAVHLSRNYSSTIRVNAIAPGFFLTEQNRFLLTNEDGSTTARGQQIIDHTPMGRYGSPEDLTSTLFWLLAADSAFVHGVVVPVDGGFNAYSGV